MGKVKVLLVIQEIAPGGIMSVVKSIMDNIDKEIYDVELCINKEIDFEDNNLFYSEFIKQYKDKIYITSPIDSFYNISKHCSN